MASDVEDWWRKAQEGLDTARYNLEGKRFDAAAFYSQQAAEKALKALLIKEQQELRKTHDLV